MTVFLDLDGCLVDSREAIGSAINAVFTDAGLEPLTAAELDCAVGPPILSSFISFLSVRGSRLDPLTIVAAFRECYAAISVERTRLQPGVAEVMPELSAAYRLAVVTSKAQYLAEPIIASTGLGVWTSAVFGPPRDRLDETKSATLARARAALKDGTAMVGDRHHDIEAGRAHWLRTIGVTWGSGSRAELLAAGADAIVDRPSELIGVIPRASSRP